MAFAPGHPLAREPVIPLHGVSYFFQLFQVKKIEIGIAIEIEIKNSNPISIAISMNSACDHPDGQTLHIRSACGRKVNII
jgi:hypothetical protein